MLGRRKGSRLSNRRPGIALFVLMTALIVLSLGMKELFQMTSSSAERVRNSVDRIQALYLARSTLNLSRFFIAYDRVADSTAGANAASDSLSDLWARPIPFPVPVELLLGEKEKNDEDGAEAEKPADSREEIPDDQKSKITRCNEFFEDFGGTAVSTTYDLSGRLSLNDLGHASKLSLETLFALLTPNTEFVQKLQSKNLNAEAITREIRDFGDRDEIELETNAPEDSPYSAAQLSYKPKNRPYMILDELKLVPAMDDELYEYLSDKVNPYYIPLRSGPDKINLNTCSKELFAALLKDASNPEEISAEFVKDRKEKQRVYKDADIAQLLQDNLRLDKDNIRLSLLTGKSDAFKIETEASVNQTELKLETIVSRAGGVKKMEPIVLMRVSP